MRRRLAAEHAAAEPPSHERRTGPDHHVPQPSRKRERAGQHATKIEDQKRDAAHPPGMSKDHSGQRGSTNESLECRPPPVAERKCNTGRLAAAPGPRGYAAGCRRLPAANTPRQAGTTGPRCPVSTPRHGRPPASAAKDSWQCLLSVQIAHTNSVVYTTLLAEKETAGFSPHEAGTPPPCSPTQPHPHPADPGPLPVPAPTPGGPFHEPPTGRGQPQRLGPPIRPATTSTQPLARILSMLRLSVDVSSCRTRQMSEACARRACRSPRGVQLADLPVPATQGVVVQVRTTRLSMRRRTAMHSRAIVLILEWESRSFTIPPLQGGHCTASLHIQHSYCIYN